MRSLPELYKYFGAHRAIDRAFHERERAIQRFLFPVLLIPGGVWVGQELGLTTKAFLDAFTILPMLYGVLGLAYLFYLRARPAGGATVQYAFIILDPIVTEAVIAYEPAAFSWMSIMLFIIVTRTGVRYGMRTLLLTWVSAIIGAAALYLLVASTSAAWQDSKHTYLVVGFALLVGVPLFMPVIRAQLRSRELELKRLEAESLARGRNEFLSQVSHELRSPLQAIIGTLETIGLRSTQFDAEAVQRLNRAATAISRQLTDLLTLAKGEAGKLNISPCCVTVKNLLLPGLNEWRDVAEEKGLLLQSNIEYQDVDIVLDAGRVAQIVDNIVHNAVKYTEKGGTIKFTSHLDATNSVLVFSVADTGIGIDEAHHRRIFDPYVRVAGKDDKTSAGIGLVVVNTLVSNLGGRLKFESTRGIGTKITVQLPYARRSNGLSDTPKLKRILIVDDGIDVLETLGTLARELGYQVDMAPSAGAARNFVVAESYETVLIDLEMPVISGVEFAKWLVTERGVGARSKLVAMTGGEHDVQCDDFPFRDLVRKPISARRLRSILSA